MAKKSKETIMNTEENTAAAEAPAVAEATAPAAPTGAGGKAIMYDVGGVQMRRVDFIRKRWAEGVARGEIAKECTQLEGKKVIYQIVFQATKGIVGGPAKVAAAPVAEAAPAE